MNQKESQNARRKPTDFDFLRARRVIYFFGKILSKGKNIILIPVVNGIVGGLLISHFDGKSLAEGQYLAVITALTVGYGDLAPETWPSRIVAAFIGFNGILFTGIVVAFTLKAVEMAFREELEQIERKGAEMDG